MTQFQQMPSASGGQSAGASLGSAFGGGMSLFTKFPAAAMQTYVVITLTVLTLSNIIAARIVSGGDRYMYYFYAAIFCTLTGLVLLVAPMVVGLFFSAQALANIGGGLNGTVCNMKENTRRLVLFAVIVGTGSVMIFMDIPLIVLLLLILAVCFLLMVLLGSITTADIKTAVSKLTLKNLRQNPPPKGAIPRNYPGREHRHKKTTAEKKPGRVPRQNREKPYTVSAPTSCYWYHP